MIFWLWTGLSAAVMLAVLSLLATYTSSDTLWITPAAMTISVIIAVLVSGLLLWHINQPMPRTWAMRCSKLALTVGLLVLSLVLFGLRAYQVYQRDAIIRPTDTLQVRATVQIDSLSDGIYDKAYEDKSSGFVWRQKARLSNITPIYTQTQTLPATMTVLLYAPNQDKFAPLEVGQQATMELQLKPLPTQSRYGFDSFRWLVGRHIHATANIAWVDTSSIKTQDNPSLIIRQEQARAYYRTLFYERWQHANLDDKQSLAVTLSLLTGDRALIDKPTYELYQYGGIMHLLAISGAHVLFLAILLAFMVIQVINITMPSLYQYIARWQLRWLVMVAAALLYALFTGFEVPAMRTVIMLIVAGVARWLLLGLSSLKVLAISAIIMAYHDPYVLWQAGFWLSVVAVAILIRYEDNAINGTGSWQWRDVMAMCWTMIKLQLYVFILMLPISILLFGRVSVFGALVNLVAVGLFGWLIVPLNLLAGLTAMVSLDMAWGLWQLVSGVLATLAQGLSYLRLLVGESWLSTQLSVAWLLLFGLAVLLARGDWLAKRFAFLPALAMLLAMTITPHQHNTHVVLNVLDDDNISHVLIRHQDHAWLVLQLHGHNMPSHDKLATWLYQTLKQHGVARLDGVIISDDNRELLHATRKLGGLLPIAGIWWAGEHENAPIPVRQCHAQAVLTSGDVQMTFLTGWQNTPLKPCALMVQSNTPSQIHAYLPQGHQRFEYDSTAVVIDSTQHSDTWAMYQLLCHNHTTMPVNLVLTHSQSVFEQAIYQHFGQPTLAFHHALNATQAQAANVYLAQRKTH